MHICIQMLSLLYVMWYIAEFHPNVSGAASSHSTVARSRLFSGLFFKIIKSRNSYIHVFLAWKIRGENASQPLLEIERPLQFQVMIPKWIWVYYLFANIGCSLDMTLLALETRCLHGSPLQTEGQPENIRPTILHPENCRPLFFLYTKTLSSVIRFWFLSCGWHSDILASRQSETPTDM